MKTANKQTPVFWILLYLLIAPAIASSLGGIQFGVLFAGIGAVALLFIRLEDITRLRFLGIEAELREKVEEVDETIVALRKLAALSAKQMLHGISAAGRLARQDKAFSDVQRRDEIVALLKELKIEDREIVEATSDFNTLTAKDIIRWIWEKTNKHSDLEKARERIDVIRNNQSEPLTLEQLQGSFAGVEIPLEIKEAILDYEYFLDNRTLRRQETLKNTK